MNVQMNIFKPLLAAIFIPIVDCFVIKYQGNVFANMEHVSDGNLQ